MRALPLGVLLALALAGCATTAPPGEASYTVQEHDTLYSIAWRHGLDYRELARWNGIGADYRISVGQRLVLQPATPAPQRGSVAAPVHAPRPAPGHEAQDAAAAAHERLAWVWPTDHATAPRMRRSGGLLFLGQPGQQVRAAARGHVVYTGSGIRGYGQLIIIKHTPTLLSAYAYNEQVLVQEGQEVAAGQPIATMGAGPHQAGALYFEIRVDGRPINPLPLLAGRN